MIRRPIGLLVTGATALALAGCGTASMVGVHDAPAQVTTTALISPETAEQIATRVLAKAQEASSATGEKAQSLREQALTGNALVVANAAKLQTSSYAASPTAPVERSEPPKVLAVSRGTAWPRVMVVQTTGADGSTTLNLLSSPDAATPFRLSASARMHPGASVAALDSVTNGSPIVTDGAGLPVAPDDLLAGYAGALAYPKAKASAAVSTDDVFSRTVRANAAVQAKSFGKLASLSQAHSPQKGAVAIRLKDGGALVFGLLSRSTTIRLAKGGKSLTPSPEFQRLVGKKKLTRSAELRSYETVVFTVPTEGRASLVAVDEVLYSAKGS